MIDYDETVFEFEHDEIKRAQDFLKKDRAAREKWLMEAEAEDIEQLVIIRKRAIEYGKLADICFNGVAEYIHFLAAKDPTTLKKWQVGLLEKAGKEFKLRHRHDGSP